MTYLKKTLEIVSKRGLKQMVITVTEVVKLRASLLEIVVVKKDSLE